MTPEPPILADQWHARSPELNAMFDDVRRDAGHSREVTVVEPKYIEFGGFRRVQMVACRHVAPHTDFEFGPYTALWVMLASGHRIGMSNYVPRQTSDCPRRPKHRVEILAVPGEIITLNVHKYHWCLKADGVFAAVSIDFAELPSREEIEAAFVRGCGA